MGFSDRCSSYWKDSIAEIEVAEQPKKHREIDAFSHLNWAITAPNLFLVLILLMSFVTPSSCADSKTRTNNVRIQMPSRASEVGTKKVSQQSWTETTSSGSQHVIKIANEHASQHTAQMQGNWKMSSGSGRVNINNEHVIENTAFQEMFQHWATGCDSGLMDEIERILGIKTTDITIEEAKTALTSLKPPPPPPGTVPGYPPALNEPRPTTIEEYLRKFEVMFVVDDSASMKGKRWMEARDALATIAQKAYELKVDTMNMRFLNSASNVRGVKGKKKLISWFDKVKPQGNTPLGRRLKVVFDEHLNRTDSAVREGPEKYSKILPLDIIVLTDGMPTDKGENEPAKVVAKAVKRLKDSHYHPNTMNVQIVQIANEKKAEKVLKDLVVGDNGRIVDTVPYAGIVDSEKLQKILLKGVHPNIRSQMPEEMLAI